MERAPRMCYFPTQTVKKTQGTSREKPVKVHKEKKKPNPHTKERRSERARAERLRAEQEKLGVIIITFPNTRKLAALAALINERRKQNAGTKE